MGKIDDPWDASRQAWEDETQVEAGETALALTGLLNPAMMLFSVLRDRFLSSNRAARLKYLFEGITLKFKEIESRSAISEAEISTIKEKIASLEFGAAAATAAEEAVRAVNSAKIDQFSSILVGSVDPKIIEDSAADASSLIRDIAQLSAMDLQVLRHLEEAYGHLFPSYPNVHDPNAFTEKFQDFKDAITRSRLHPEEFQSVCERLRGFGLAAEVLRNNSRMSLAEYCYRPTRRGRKLLHLLGSSASGNESGKSSEATESQPTVAHRAKTAIESAISAIDYWTPKVSNLYSPTQLPPSILLDFPDAAVDLEHARQISVKIADLMVGGYDKLRQAKSEIEHARQWKPLPGGLQTRPPGNPMPYLLGGRNLFMEAKRLFAELGKAGGE